MIINNYKSDLKNLDNIIQSKNDVIFTLKKEITALKDKINIQSGFTIVPPKDVL